jgi:outer membrane protein assembly factor BamA
MRTLLSPMPPVKCLLTTPNPTSTHHPTTPPPLVQVDLTINLVERKTGGLGAGTGISAAGRAAGNMPGFVGNFTYR